MLQIQTVKLPNGLYLAIRREHKGLTRDVVYKQNEENGEWTPITEPMFFSWKKEDIQGVNQITLSEESEESER